MVRLREAGCPPKLRAKEGLSLHYVYLIESLSAQDQRYVGLTDHLKQRFQEHNEGKSSHTSKSTPWKLTTYIAFTNRGRRKISSNTSNPGRVMHLPASASGDVGACAAAR